MSLWSITADLSHPIRVTRSFEKIHYFLIKLTNRPLLKQYLRRDKISRDLSDCDNSLRDALTLFGVSSEMFAKSLSYSQRYRFRSKSAYLNKPRKRRNTGRRKPRCSLKRLWVVVCQPPPLIQQLWIAFYNHFPISTRWSHNPHQLQLKIFHRLHKYYQFFSFDSKFFVVEIKNAPLSHE